MKNQIVYISMSMLEKVLSSKNFKISDLSNIAAINFEGTQYINLDYKTAQTIYAAFDLYSFPTVGIYQIEIDGITYVNINYGGAK